jgi:3-oxoadipate enol-lactonase
MVEGDLADSRSYQRDDLTLAYSVVGDGEPILFVHGATATGEFEWSRLSAKLPGNYRCIWPDLRGHGRSQYRPADNLGAAIGADLTALIEHLDLDHPHVVAFSYGSEIALMLEVAAPGTARSLTLISPGIGRASGYQMPSLEYLHRTWPRSLRRLHEAHHGPEHWRSLVTLLQQDSGSRSELSPQTLASIGCPVLLLAGEGDEPTRRDQGRRFAEHNERARYLEISGAAHAVHHEYPDRIAQVIGDFLGGVDRERAGRIWDETRR